MRSDLVLVVLSVRDASVKMVLMLGRGRRIKSSVLLCHPLPQQAPKEEHTTTFHFGFNAFSDFPCSCLVLNSSMIRDWSLINQKS